MEEIFEKHFYIVILCGGSGKRLWPCSRAKTPKQFLKLFGDQTIFQDTVARAKRFVPPSRIFLVTNEDYLDEVHEQSPEIPHKNIIAEPIGKNTALAVGMAALYIHQIDPLGIVVNFASDHHVEDIRKFELAVETAVEAANLGDYLVTIGVKPTFPHTGMGYIKTSSLFKRFDHSTAYKVDKFIEKPTEPVAEKFLAEGGYYWNANLYTWRVDSILRAIELHMPELSHDLEKIRESIGKKEEKEVIARIYEKAPNTSIDYGVSEKAKNMLLVPSSFTWSDIGDWKVAYDISKKDKDGNVVIFDKGKGGSFLGLDTKDCLVHFSNQLVATIGVNDLIIVDTKDALLIVRKDRAEEVKTFVNQLLEKKKEEYI